MFLSKDMFQDEDDNNNYPPSTQTKPTYQQNKNTYQQPQQQQNNPYGNNEDGDDDFDVYNNTPATDNQSNNYHANSNSNAMGSNANNNNYYNAQPQPTTSQPKWKQSAPAKPNPATTAKTNNNGGLMNILYSNDIKQMQELETQQPQYSNNSNYYNNNDNGKGDEPAEGAGFDFEEPTNSQSQYQPQPQSNAYAYQSAVHHGGSTGGQYQNLNETNNDDSILSRPMTSTSVTSSTVSRPGTANSDAKKLLLQKQKEMLLKKQREKGLASTITSNDMLRPQNNGPVKINYSVEPNDVNVNLHNPNTISYYDPSMKNRNGSNLPELSKLDPKMKFPEPRDESPKNSKIDRPDNTAYEMQMKAQEQERERQAAERERQVAERERQLAERERLQMQAQPENEKENSEEDEDEEDDPNQQTEPQKNQKKGEQGVKVELGNSASLGPKNQQQQQLQTQQPQGQQQPQQAEILRIMTPNELDGMDMRSFLMRPCPKKTMIQCTIRRDKSGFNRFYPKYLCYMSLNQRFLLVGKKRSSNKTSNYLVSYNKDVINNKPPFYLGKLRSNFLGTEFNIWDSGLSPKKSPSRDKFREQMGVVQYESNLLGARGPRKMKVLIPDVKPTGEVYQFQPLSEKEGILNNHRAGKKEGIKEMFNKPPKWNDQVQAFVLNFNGRVEKPSVKNFQLIDEHDENTIVLQFGRVTDEAFNMDFQWPLSPFQAFSICLSSFDYKLACE
jgi:tubby-related protein 1